MVEVFISFRFKHLTLHEITIPAQTRVRDEALIIYGGDGKFGFPGCQEGERSVREKQAFWLFRHFGMPLSRQMLNFLSKQDEINLFC